MIGLDRTLDRRDEVDAVIRERLERRHTLLAWQGARPVVLDHHPDADDEVRTHGLAHRPDDPPREAQPRLRRAAVLVLAPVRPRREEAVEEVAVRLQFDAVEPAGLAAQRGAHVVVDDPVEVPLLGLLGEGAVGRLAHRRGRDGRQPVAGVVRGAPPEVGHLDHHGGAVFVDVVGELAEPRDDLVLVEVQVAEGRRAVRGDDRRPADHRQRDAALRLLAVVEAVALLGHAVVAVRRLVRGADDAVAQVQRPEVERLEQRVEGGKAHGDILRAGRARCSRRCESRVGCALRNSVSEPVVKSSTADLIHMTPLLRRAGQICPPVNLCVARHKGAGRHRLGSGQPFRG